MDTQLLTREAQATAVGKKRRNNPILVTGSHRSGSTWVGNMIAEAPEIGYIHEPFNLHTPPGISSAPFRYWYTYIGRHNEDVYYPHLKRTLDFRYDLLAEIKAIRRPRRVGRILRDGPRVVKHRVTGSRPLMKDPIAFFSAEWLESTFDMDVVVLVRHPAAFASSLKRLNWAHRFPHFIAQPELMRSHLIGFEDEIRKMAETPSPIVEQAALLWNIINTNVLRYRERHPDWLFIRHEDLSRDPIGSFERIFDALGVSHSKKTLDAIHASTNATNPGDAPVGGDTIVRDSRTNISNWKKRLDKDEIHLLRSRVDEVASNFYADEDWQ